MVPIREKSAEAIVPDLSGKGRTMIVVHSDHGEPVRREQNTTQVGCSGKDRPEAEDIRGARSAGSIKDATTVDTDTTDLMNSGRVVCHRTAVYRTVRTVVWEGG